MSRPWVREASSGAQSSGKGATFLGPGQAPVWILSGEALALGGGRAFSEMQPQLTSQGQGSASRKSFLFGFKEAGQESPANGVVGRRGWRVPSTLGPDPQHLPAGNLGTHTQALPAPQPLCWGLMAGPGPWHGGSMGNLLRERMKEA